MILPRTRVGGLLRSADSFGSPMTHEVRLSGRKDISAKLTRWLRRAYENAAPPIEVIEGRTGKSVSRWISEIRNRGLRDRLAILQWLRADQNLSRDDAAFVAREFRLALEYGDYEILRSHFSGANNALRPLFERVAAMFRRFGPDVTVMVEKEEIVVRRHEVIATIRAHRRYLEIALPQPGAIDEEQDGSSATRRPLAPRRVRVVSPRQVDERLRPLARTAYTLVTVNSTVPAGCGETADIMKSSVKTPKIHRTEK